MDKTSPYSHSIMGGAGYRGTGDEKQQLGFIICAYITLAALAGLCGKYNLNRSQQHIEQPSVNEHVTESLLEIMTTK